MERVYNFSPGPSQLPLPVLEKAQKDLVCYGDTGMSVMEMSHRSKVFLSIFEETKANFKRIFHVPDEYEVLFLGGGGTLQFAMAPMKVIWVGNLMPNLSSGSFSEASKVYTPPA